MPGIFDDDASLVDSPEEGQEDEEEVSEGPADEEEAGEPDEDESEEEIPAKFKGDREKFEKSYRSLEQELTRRAEENKALKEQMAYVAGMMAAAQAAPKDAPQEEKLDPEAWLEKLYQGPEIIDERINKKVQETLSQVLTPVLGPMQQAISQTMYDRQAMALASKYPDFVAMVPEIQQMIAEFPELASRQDGFERAYQLAKASQNSRLSAKQVSTMLKQAARMPGSSARIPGKPLTPEDAIKRSIFGTDNKNKGVFD